MNAHKDAMSHEATYEALRSVSRLVPAEQAIVEIGTYKAAGSIALAESSEAHVWTVDPHDLPGERSTTGDGPRPRHPVDYTDPSIREAAERNIREAGYSDRITMIRDFSTNVPGYWDGPLVGLLVIDGDHRAPAVRQDFSAWEKHLASRAWVIWDDHTAKFTGVQRVVEATVKKGLVEYVAQAGDTLITRRVK